MASVYTYISRVKSPQNVYLGLLEDSSQAQADTRPLRHKADKLVRKENTIYMFACFDCTATWQVLSLIRTCFARTVLMQ